MVLFFVVIALAVTACLPSEEELRAVTYAPAAEDDWQISTAEAHGSKLLLVAGLCDRAAQLQTTYGVL